MRRLVKSAWCVAVVAGIGIIDARAATAASTGLWCDWLRVEPARVQDDPDHPWLQSLRFHGKFQYQLGLVHGTDVDGADFRESYDDYRRLRIGLESTFLQVMNLKTTVNLVDDQRLEGGSLDWGFAGFHEALVGLDLGEVLGRGPFDEWRVDYGRHKFIAGQETRVSSNHLLTVERSAIVKKIYESARPTGVSITASRGRWIWSGAMFSSTQDGADNESLSGWQDGLVWLGSAARRINDRLNLGVDLAWNDADARREDSFLSYRWATSWHGEYDAGEWGVRGDLIVGDNGGAAMHEDSVRRGAFHGFVLTPYRWIVGRKLQLVGQYQCAVASSPEGLRVSVPYDRAPSTPDLNHAYGDSHHSLYAGLNHHFCDDFTKVQFGLEWQRMDTPTGAFDTLTWLLALRTSF